MNKGLTWFFRILGFIVAALPSVMLDLPVWATVLIFLAFQLLPIPFLTEIYWLAGLIGAFLGKQDAFAIAYYILTVIPIFRTVMNILIVLWEKKQKENQSPVYWRFN
jgi:hypothetical protein